MSPFDAFRKFDPKLISFFLFYVVPIIIFFRYIVSTLYGIFFFSIALYFYRCYFGESKPYSPDQLLLWIDGIPSESKSSIVSVFVTIIGFLIAFHSAKTNWIFQARTQLKLQVAKEIRQFYRDAIDEIGNIQLFVKSVIRALDLYKAEGPSEKAHLYASWTLKDLPEFERARNRVSTLSVNVADLVGSNFVLLSTISGAVDALKDCERALQEVAEAMWILLPQMDADSPDFLAAYASQVDRNKYENLITLCEKNSNFISGMHGGVVGALTQEVTGFSLQSVFTIYKDKDGVIEAFEALQSKNK